MQLERLCTAWSLILLPHPACSRIQVDLEAGMVVEKQIGHPSSAELKAKLETKPVFLEQEPGLGKAWEKSCRKVQSLPFP